MNFLVCSSCLYWFCCMCCLERICSIMMRSLTFPPQSPQSSHQRRSWIILALLIGVLVLIYHVYEAKYAHAMDQLQETINQKHDAEKELDELKQIYQIDEMNRCIESTMSVMTLEAKLEHVRARKSKFCGLLTDPPDTVLNPQNHYKVEYNSSSWDFEIAFIR